MLQSAIIRAAIKTAGLSLFIYCFNRKPFATGLTIFFVSGVIMEMEEIQKEAAIRRIAERAKAAMN